MKKTLLTLIVSILFLSAMAQDFEIIGVESLPADFSAREEIKTDHNDRQCALLRVATQNVAPNQREGFSFVPDLGSEVVERASRDGEIWLWVSPGVKYLRIKHREWGQYELYLPDYVSRVEALHTYKITIKGTLAMPLQEQGNNAPTQQYLAFQISPTNAVLEVDGKIWEVEADGSSMQYVPFGKYNYQVRLENYHTYSGTVMVDDPDNMHKEVVNLSPNFGWIEVKGNEVLNDASVYIDDALAGKVPFKSKALKSGKHSVRIVKKLYDEYGETVTVTDNQTITISPNLSANFAEITLKVDADAEIWVNNEKKGARTWTGTLGSGIYKIECKQENHETTVTTKEIVPKMQGQTLTLEAPRPIYGSLNVVSTPNFAKIYLDGNLVGETPKFVREVLIGSHNLRLEKEGCASLTKAITITKGETLEVQEKLDSGRSVTVKTDRDGDQIFVDGDLVGRTPCETTLGFGHHTIRVVRNGVKVEKEIEILQSTTNGRVMTIEFGRLVTISTDKEGDEVLVDGVKVGTSPVSVDLPYGKHTIHAQRDKKYADKDIEVLKTGGLTEHSLVLHGETASHFVENGVNFATVNFAYSHAPQTSYGVCYGSVKKVGWFVTAMSNFAFDALKADLSCDAQGCVNGEYPDYDGTSCTSRLSLMGGLMVGTGSPVCFRIGAGYGSRVKSWNTTDGHLVKAEANSYSGIDATAGIQLNLKGFTVSADVVTTNFKTIEAKIGLGYCWKRK